MAVCSTWSVLVWDSRTNFSLLIPASLLPLFPLSTLSLLLHAPSLLPTHWHDWLVVTCCTGMPESVGSCTSRATAWTQSSWTGPWQAPASSSLIPRWRCAALPVPSLPQRCASSLKSRRMHARDHALPQSSCVVLGTAGCDAVLLLRSCGSSFCVLAASALLRCGPCGRAGERAGVHSAQLSSARLPAVDG